MRAPRLARKPRPALPRAGALRGLEVPGGVRPGRHRRRRRRRALRASAAALVLVVGLLGADAAVYGGRVHPGVEVAGTSLGGRSPEDAEAALAALAEDLMSRPLRFRWEGRDFRATPRELGWRPDVAATAAAALDVGWSGPLWEDVWTRTGAWFRPARVPWTSGWDEAALAEVVAGWSEAVAVPPTEGRVEVVGTEVRASDPVPGRAIDAEAVAALAAEALDGDREGPLPMPVVTDDPLTTAGDVRLAVAEVEALIARPVTARVGDASVEVSADELASLVRVRLSADGGDAALVPELDPAGVEALLAPLRPEVETAPRPAAFVTRGSTVRIRPSRPGRVIDPDLSAAHLLRLARSPARAGRIPLARKPPRFTTAKARALGIVEQVSSFTTFHAAGEPRVLNIHRAADLLDGAIVRPGRRFSMNEHLGERTSDRGFVEAPVIYDGEFTTDVGGGVSQLATTLFNAVFFGGYPFLEYQPHSFYISRYPMGREATVSFPKPDLVFRNDTSTALLIKTEYTDSSITVRIFGDRHGRTVRATDPVVVGRSEAGFTVVVHRIVEEGGREVRRDTFTTFYRVE